jgi:AcrR family transcriptional regulator
VTRRVSGKRPVSGASGPGRDRRRRPASGKARVRRPSKATRTSHLEPRRRPRQERARATFDAILVAAREIIARDGWGSLTTNKVADRAGVSIGSLYQYFPNKETILVTLLEEHMAGVRPLIEESLNDLADAEVAFSEALRRMFVRLIARHRDADPRLQRVLGEEVPRPPHVRAAQRRQEAEYTARVAAILAARRDVETTRPEMAALVVVQATSALTRWLAHDAPPGLDRQAYVEEAVGLLSAHLRRSPG